MMKKNTNQARIVSIIFMIFLLFSVFFLDNLLFKSHAQALSNLSGNAAQLVASQSTLIPSDRFDFDTASVPVDVRDAIINLISARETDVMPNATYFVVGTYSQLNEFGYGTIGASVNNQPPDWENSIWFITNKVGEIWVASSIEFNPKFLESSPEFTPSLLPNSATENKFPWNYTQVWRYTSSWHGTDNKSVDFAPTSSVPSGEQWFLSSADGYLSLTCNDGYQAFAKVENGALGTMGYGHLESASIQSGIVNTTIPQGQRLAKAYDGTQGAGWYDIGKPWPWPSCTPNNTCNWNTRTGCCYLQYKTTCGAGTGAHFHWTLPSHNTTVEGWTIGSDGIWRKSGEANRAVGSSFSSTNSIDNLSPTTTYSLAGTAGENDWYRSAVGITLSATDNSGGSGVSQTQYKINAGNWQTYTSPFSISADGVHFIYYKSVDLQGNWESEKSTPIKIDTAAPSGSFSIQNGSPQTYSTITSLNSQGSDTTSGIALIRIRDSGQAWSDWLVPGITSWQLRGAHGQTAIVEAQFKDQAGNLSVVYADSILINIYPARPSSAQYKLPKSTFGASGGLASTSGYILNGTLGQQATGLMQSSNYKLRAGYWAISLLPVATNTFVDVPTTYWAWSYVERLYAAGITGGCATTPNLLYCPDNTVTRAQMAVFQLKSMHGPTFTPPLVGDSTGFGDVATSHWAAAWIKQLAAEGITGGCGNGNYCPEAPVTRGQMAVFLLKAKNGSGFVPPVIGDGSGFTDVPDNYWAAVWIKQLAADGITGGCGVGIYCPENPVTRAQMAVFIVKTFGLP